VGREKIVYGLLLIPDVFQPTYGVHELVGPPPLCYAITDKFKELGGKLNGTLKVICC